MAARLPEEACVECGDECAECKRKKCVDYATENKNEETDQLGNG